MEIKNARELSPAELYERRKQAVLLFKKGMSHQEIGDIVGAHRNTVGRWLKSWRKDGSKALKPALPGRPLGSGRRLSSEQEAKLKRQLVDKTPDQLKLDFALWTRNAVQEYIHVAIWSYHAYSDGRQLPSALGIHSPKAG